MKNEVIFSSHPHSPHWWLVERRGSRWEEIKMTEFDDDGNSRLCRLAERLVARNAGMMRFFQIFHSFTLLFTRRDRYCFDFDPRALANIDRITVQLTDIKCLQRFSFFPLSLFCEDFMWRWWCSSRAHQQFQVHVDMLIKRVSEWLFLSSSTSCYSF